MTLNFSSLPVSTTVELRSVVENSDLAVEVVDATLTPGALERPVRWAHVSELREPAAYLLGEELLLTAGVHLPTSADEVHEYVRGLVAAGVSALGFGVTPPMHVELPPVLRTACVRHGLPLLVIPADTPFLAVSRAVAVAVNETAHRDQRRVAEAREALTDAADNGVPRLIRELAARLSGWAMLVGPDDVVHAQHRAPLPTPVEVTGLLRRLRDRRGHRTATTDLPDGTVVVAQPVTPSASASDLLVIGRSSRLDEAERTILAVGAVLSRLAGRADSDATALGAATTALLLADSPADTLGEILGTGDYRVLAGIPREDVAPAPLPGQDWLRERLNTCLLRLDGHGFTAISIDLPDAALRTELRDNGWLTVVSGPRPANELPDAHAEVAMLSRRARVLDRTIIADEDGLGLTSIVPHDAAARFAERTLEPLVRLDRDRAGTVLETVRTWLARHGNWDRTAKALGVHRNSVRNRIRQAERALDIDLADPQHRMELWFALRWAGHTGDQ